MALVFDTAPLYAALDRSDRYHQACRSLVETFREPLLIPAPVLVEMDQLVSMRLWPAIFVAFLDDVLDRRFQVVDLIEEDYARARELCDSYADSDIGFVDAAVLAIVERLNEPKLATLDHRHFSMMRPRHVRALALLPE